jgi:hypothetical protein
VEVGILKEESIRVWDSYRRRSLPCFLHAKGAWWVMCPRPSLHIAVLPCTSHYPGITGQPCLFRIASSFPLTTAHEDVSGQSSSPHSGTGLPQFASVVDEVGTTSPVSHFHSRDGNRGNSPARASWRSSY